MKKKKKKVNLKPFLYLLIIVLPVLVYFLLILRHTNLFMLTPEGYSYIWFWNILSSGKLLPIEATLPRPLLVFFYGLLSSPNLVWIELLKVFVMVGLGYGIFKLSYRITDNHLLAFLTEVLALIIPITVKNTAFGTGTFIAATFTIWALYSYIEEHYYLVSLLLLLGGLIRMDVWIIPLFLVIHSKIATGKFRFPLIIAFLSPVLWFAFDFFLTKDPFYSFKVLKYYFSITQTPMLTHKQILHSLYNTFQTSYGPYISILLLLTTLFSFLKRRVETILLVSGAITILSGVIISSLFTGFFRAEYVFIPLLWITILIPFFIQSIFSFTNDAIAPFVFLLIIGFSLHTYRNNYKKLINYAIYERNRQETCREMAPQVSVIDDKKVLMPYRRIGMFAYLNKKAYTHNILSERDIVAKGLGLKDLNYIVFIAGDFDRAVISLLAPILKDTKDEVIRTDNIVIQKLFTTPNGLGKIFKIFVLKETSQDRTFQAPSRLQ